MRLTLVSFGVLSVVLAVTARGHAAVPSSVPQKALDELAYRVGEWTSTGFSDGVEQPKPGHEVTKWEPGKYCIQIRGSFVENGVEIHASGLVGWDAEKKQLIEHWYASDGSYATFRYALDKKKDSWVGTFAWIYSDGTKLEGPSVVEKKSPDEWEWNAFYERDGEKHTWRTINRKAKK